MIPWNDRSGDRLRDWMGVDRATFYDAGRVAIIPMDFYLVWGFIKLGLYAVACQYSIWAILWCMVAVHVFGGVCLMIIAYAEFKRVSSAKPRPE